MKQIISSSETAADKVEEIGEKADKSGGKLKTLSSTDLFPLKDTVQDIVNEFDKFNALEAGINTQLKEMQALAGVIGDTLENLDKKKQATAKDFSSPADPRDQLKEKKTSNNTATGQANAMMNGSNETMLQEKSWFDDIAVGLENVTSKITPFINVVAGSVTIMANLAKAKEEVGRFFNLLKTMPAIGTIVMGASSLVTGALGVMGTAIKALGTAIMNIPVLGWVAAIVAGLIALGTYFYKTSSTFRGFLWGLWDAVKTVFTGIWDFIKEVAQGVLKLLQGIFNPLNWFNKDDSFPEEFRKIADAAASYGKSIQESFSKGRQHGIEDFNQDNPEKDPGTNPGTNPVMPGTGPLNIMPLSPVITPGQLSPSDPSGLTRSGLSGSSAGAIKSIDQKIDIKNYFTISDDAGKNNFEAIAEKIVRAINDKLSDSIIATT